jgi:hypothetical protein
MDQVAALSSLGVEAASTRNNTDLFFENVFLLPAQIEAPRLIEALACAVERGGPELETATFAAYTTLESAKVGDALAASPKFPRLLQIITEGLAGRGGGREGGLAEGSDEAAGALKALLSSGDASVRLEKGEGKKICTISIHGQEFHGIPFQCITSPREGSAASLFMALELC